MIRECAWCHSSELRPTFKCALKYSRLNRQRCWLPRQSSNYSWQDIALEKTKQRTREKEVYIVCKTFSQCRQVPIVGWLQILVVIALSELWRYENVISKYSDLMWQETSLVFFADGWKGLKWYLKSLRFGEVNDISKNSVQMECLRFTGCRRNTKQYSYNGCWGDTTLLWLRWCYSCHHPVIQTCLTSSTTETLSWEHNHHLHHHHHHHHHHHQTSTSLTAAIITQSLFYVVLYLAVLCALVWMVKTWPFQRLVKWPPTIGDQKVTAWITW